MRGRVLSYDGATGAGFIVGDSGVRYSFSRADLRRLSTLGEGTVVEFHPEDDRAREVFIVDAAPPPAPVHFGRFAEQNGAAAPTGLWAYTRRCVTGRYATFAGRARRKEYWGFYLFYLIGLALSAAVGLFADGAMDTLDDGAVATIGLTVLYVLVLFVPALAVTIRRLHDIGLSGWFYLLVFVPSVGALIILVMSLIPSQKHENKWGPVPEGIVA